MFELFLHSGCFTPGYSFIVLTEFEFSHVLGYFVPFAPKHACDFESFALMLKFELDFGAGASFSYKIVVGLVQWLSEKGEMDGVEN